MGMYLKFGAMIGTSTLVMFVLMYLNTFQWDHVYYSETRVYMAFIERANILDPRVRDLANRIIESQRMEIEEMRQLIEDWTAQPMPGITPCRFSRKSLRMGECPSEA